MLFLVRQYWQTLNHLPTTNFGDLETNKKIATKSWSEITNLIYDKRQSSRELPFISSLSLPVSKRSLLLWDVFSLLSIIAALFRFTFFWTVSFIVLFCCNPSHNFFSSQSFSSVLVKQSVFFLLFVSSVSFSVSHIVNYSSDRIIVLIEFFWYHHHPSEYH